MDLPGSYAATHGSPVAWALPVVVSALWLAASFTSVRCERLRSSTIVALSISALLSIGCYVDWGRFRYGTYLNEWDVYHYYVGTKYADELGYFGLYESTLVADVESIHRYHNPHHRIRDLRTSAWVDVEDVLERRTEIRGRFTDERWTAFVSDVRFFAESLPSARYSILLEDKGLNGTPTWTFFVRTLLTEHFSVRTTLGRVVLLAIDPLLMALAFEAIRRAYGLRASLVSIVLVGTHYLLSWGHLKGALVRTDFATCAAMSVCALKLGRPRLAGILLAWSAVSRVFPVLLAVGPAAVLLGRFVRTRRWDPSLRAFFGAFTLTLVVSSAIAAIGLGGTAPFVEWLEKIVRHATDPISVNVGYSVIVDADFFQSIPRYVHMDQLLREDPDVRHQRSLALALVVFTVLLPAAAFVSRLEADRALAFGFTFVFFLSPFAYYYALMLLPFLLFFVSDRSSRLCAFGTVSVLLGGAAGYLFFSGWPRFSQFPIFRGYHQEFGTYFYMSWLLGFSVMLAIVAAGLEAWRSERREVAEENAPR